MASAFASDVRLVLAQRKTESPENCSVVLSVPGMNCASCPLTVSIALKKVEGVRDVDVTCNKKEATVTFDDDDAWIGDSQYFR